MFRHPNLKNNNGTFDDISFEKKIDQSIRYFKVPAMKEKEGVLNLLLNEILTTNIARNTGNKIRQIYFTVGSVAAAACVALFFFYSFFMVETFNGSDQLASNVYYLPDDSRIVLADDAEIKFSKLFFQRNVKLKGEAYFEVEAGSDFYVKTNEGGVLVIGTRFSVSDLDNNLLVHCYEGVVGIDFNREKIKISEGVQFAGFNQSINVNEDYDLGYPEYAIFNYSCENRKLEEVWPVIEQYFGIDIIANDSFEKAFTGSFYTGNIEEVIDIICTSMEMTYQLIDEKQVIVEPKE